MSRTAIRLVLLVSACAPGGDGADDDTDDTDVPEPVDLVTRLGPDEARAGVVTDPEALFGGIFSEGRPGDVKVYNDRVRFVIQGVRDGSYIVPQGGGVLDADVVRPEGHAGRDLVKDWHGMVGIGRVVDPEVVEVVEDGLDGGSAVVRVEGPVSPMGFLAGNLESPELVSVVDARVEHVYTLRPGSWLLEVKTTVTAGSEPVEQAFGDLLMGAPEVAWGFGEGGGLDGPSGPFRWTSYVGHGHDGAVAVLAPHGGTLSAAGFDLIAAAADVAGGFGDPISLTPGGSASWTRYYGVGPDLATMTDAWLADEGVALEAHAGVVTAPDGPVAGAWVVALVDGRPFTVAVTGEDGSFTLDAPAGSEVALRAVGRGTGRFVDLPAGAGPSSPYAHPEVATAQRATLTGGAPGLPLAEGRGVASVEDPLVLGEPASLVVEVEDDLPFAVRVQRTAPDAPTDERYVPERPDGLAAAGWSRDGRLEMLVEPGTYDVVIHRGLRFELVSERVTLAAGEDLQLDAVLPAAYEVPGWLLVDPHSHAVSSADADIAMEDRLVTSAAVGVQVHIGTDHDRMSDYRPLIPALGLTAAMATVVAEEFSPTLRGHFNVYPIEPDPEAPDLGAWRWWASLPLPSTDAMLGFLRERHGDLVIQSNHPTDSGVASSARWRPGEVRDGARWTTGFEAIEVLNGGSNDDFLPFWWDLTSRGVLTAPVGVSDSHGHFGGSLGMSATFVKVGVDAPEDFEPASLVAAMRGREVVPTRGPFLRTSVAPGEVEAPVTVTVEALSPSWIVVDRLLLVCDGTEVERVAGAEATFELDPSTDAACVVVAEGDRPMAPVTGRTPWAMTAPWLVDADGDGWTPSLPALVVR